MITVTEAQDLLRRKTTEIAAQKKPVMEVLALKECLNRVLAMELAAPIPVPRFDNAAMDGFALKAKDSCGASSQTPVNLLVSGEVRAGDAPVKLEGIGRAIRIMTGAPIPEGADAVVMKEVISESGNEIKIFSEVNSGQHIRRVGEDIWQGAPAMSKGTRLTPGVIGFLASLGLLRVPVAVLPRIAVLATGGELVSSVENLKPGKIFDSNTFMLHATLQEMGLLPVKSARVQDDLSVLKKTFEEALEVSDVVILTGGVSVGDYDYTRKVLADLGVETLFWKVAQKPGKPFYVGYKKDQLVFGLPGNPYAVLVCFYVYVRPALSALMGLVNGELRRSQAKLWGNFEKFEKKDQRAHFLKGKSLLKDGQAHVEILAGQGSHLLKAMGEADLLIYLPKERQEVKRGEEVEVIFL